MSASAPVPPCPANPLSALPKMLPKISLTRILLERRVAYNDERVDIKPDGFRTLSRSLVS
jgi:hypothetical protein